MLNTYCKFLQTLKDGEETIWEKDKIYKVDYEDEKNFYFTEPPHTAIAKSDVGKFFLMFYRHDTEEN